MAKEVVIKFTNLASRGFLNYKVWRCRLRLGRPCKLPIYPWLKIPDPQDKNGYLKRVKEVIIKGNLPLIFELCQGLARKQQIVKSSNS